MARRVIALRGDPIVNEEEAAIAAITPGHIVEFSGTGVRKNTAAATNVALNIALEREELGKDIDEAYAIGDTVKVGAFAPGMRAYCFIPSGQNIAKGAALTTDATGCLTGASASATIRSARALEAVNNSAGPGDVRIRVEFV